VQPWARHASYAALPPRGPSAGHHFCWDASPRPRQSAERGRFLTGGVGLSPSCPQGAFPARLKKVFIVGAPMWFRVPYSIISLLLKEKLRERVSTGPPARDPWRGGLSCSPIGTEWCEQPAPLGCIRWKLLSPNPQGTEAFSALFSISSKYLEPLLKSPSISPSAVRLPAAAS